MPKVLVVDDSLSVRKVVERALESRRIDVLSAASGTEAIEQIGREEPDLVVCDVIMPDLDGYQICEFVRAHPRLGGTPVLLISGIVNSTVLERAARVRSNDVLRKPFAADELLRRIEGLLAAGGPAAEPFAAPPRGAAAFEPVAAPGSEAVAQEAAPLPDLKAALARVAGIPGVALAVLVDEEGCLIESAGEGVLGAEMAGAMASHLAGAAAEAGRELGQGALGGVIFEYGAGVVLLSPVGPQALLAAIVRDPAVLGKVRYFVKKALPEILEAL